MIQDPYGLIPADRSVMVMAHPVYFFIVFTQAATSSAAPPVTLATGLLRMMRTPFCYFVIPRAFKTSGDVSSTASSWWQAPQSCVIVFFSEVAWLSSWQRKHPGA